MENFIAYNPVQVNFGKDVCSNIGEIAIGYGKTAMLVYGKASIKKNGVFEQVEKPLKQAGVNIVEFEGIKPNPRIDDVNRAIKLGVEKKVDVVIAVGGGSVIDSAKIIAICIPENLDGWQVMTNKQKPEKTLPIISVLTLAATGTEMNMYAVLQNKEANAKIGFGIEAMFPQHSYLDPSFSMSVNKEYTAFGIVDLIAHALENYFGKGDAPLADSFVFSIIKDAMEVAPKLLNDLQNYDYRARIMWASTCALNGTTNYGRAAGDWAVHGLGHTLSLMFDTTHGVTLSIVYPAWLRFLSDVIPERISNLGKELFGVSGVEETITKLEEFFTSVNSPIRLQQAGIGLDKKEEILNHWLEKKPKGAVYKIDDKDYEVILNSMFA